MLLTKPQRKALFALWKRPNSTKLRMTGITESATGTSYRNFRKTVQPLFGGNGCIMVAWCGMWVGIETDGHTHT
jgi:hypothetical protein